MEYKLQGESLEYAVLHMAGVEMARGGMALVVTATSAPDATVLSGRLSAVYNPGKVDGGDGLSDTFTMHFMNKLLTREAYSDLCGSVAFYKQMHPGGNPSTGTEQPAHEVVYVPVYMPADAPAADPLPKTDVASTYAIVGAAALIIMLLWE